MYNGMLRNFGYAMVFGQTRETAKNVSRNECQSFLLIIKELAILPLFGPFSRLSERKRLRNQNCVTCR